MSSGAREVIQEFADGDGAFTFERGRLDKAIRELFIENPVKLHIKEVPKPSIKLNKEDVEFITKELMVTKSQAEEALYSTEGDLTKALVKLMKPPQSN